VPSVELVRIASSTLWAHKLRSFLTALGIVISVWTIVSVVSVILGMNAYVRNTIFRLSPDVFVVTRLGFPTNRDEFLEAIKRKEISEREIVRLRELCESCAEVGESLVGQKPVHAGNRRIAAVTVNGTTANILGLQNLDIEAGRYFTESEDDRATLVAVIGSEVHEELFPQLDPLGRTVWIDSVPHRIIGTIPKQGTVLGQNQDLAVYIPLRAALKRFGRQRDLNVQVNVLVRAAGGFDGVERAQEEVIQVFRWLRHTPFRASDPVGVITAEMLQTMWRAISASTFFFVSFISGLSLVVGAIVVANIMFVSVIERTREIGLRRAMGARKRDIQWQFLVEAMALSALGGALGSAAGAITAGLVGGYSPVPATVHVSVIILAMLIASVTGMLAGFFPALKAANLPPIEALHHE